MITCTSANPSQDYAVMKVLHQLTQHHGAYGKTRRIHHLTSGIDFSIMGPGEVLYIVGHGYMSGDISGVSTGSLISWLNDPKRGIPAHARGIYILTCYSGIPSTNSLADQVGAALKHRHIPVKGASGYAYGSPETRAHGLNSVLPKDLSGVYSGGLDSIVSGLRQYRAPAEMRFGTAVVKKGEVVGEVVDDATLRAWAQNFEKERNRIEGAMRTLVQKIQSGDVTSSLDALKLNQSFVALVKEQYALFMKTGLFLPKEAAYDTSDT